ncbi:MAG: bifunctional methylenetetrahydrofolate dehydrogenase/methenyltetrahydrofolate cyclohydrolase [bacterium]
MNLLDPELSAATHRDSVRGRILQQRYPIHVAGFLASEDRASRTYAEYTRARCEEAGLRFDLEVCAPNAVEQRISQANQDPGIHGVFVYYPVFADGRDARLKDQVAPHKDVEGLCAYWMEKLYLDERFDDPQKRHKCLLPCTPLAVLKLLEGTEAHSDTGLPLAGQVVSVFNRSDVVGRPLAHMLANDGAVVHSFELEGGRTLTRENPQGMPVRRAEALRESGVVVTAVPSKDFEKIRASELKDGAICVNIAAVKNFEDDAVEKAGLYIPRVGPMTVAMCLRNALRLYEDHHLPLGASPAAR